MNQLPLDPETYLRTRQVLQDCIRRGADPIEELHRADLLLTPARDKVIRLQAMNYLLRQVQSFRPAEFLRRKFHAQHSASPTDMYSCIVEFLEEHVLWWEREQ